MIGSLLRSPLADKLSATRTFAALAFVVAATLAFVRPDAHLIVAEFLAFAALAFGLRDKAT